MRIFTFVIFAVWLTFSQLTPAAVHLVVWQSSPQAPKVILPRLQTETPQEAVERYIQTVHENADLQALNPALRDLPTGFAADLPTLEKSGRVRLAFLANWFQDLTPQGARIQRNLRAFSQAGATPFVIALASDLGLSPIDVEDYRTKISGQFSLLVSLGGDDIDPKVYGQEKTFSKNTNFTRDISEFGIVKKFKQAGRGVFFGICRGHQMGAVADGHSLIQDLSKTGAGTTEHHINSKGTSPGEMQRWHHIIFEDSLLARFLLGHNRPFTGLEQVNSVHHQAVDPRDTAASKVVALDDRDGTVEALQGKNGKSFSVQFHPEFPAEISGNAGFSQKGSQIIHGIIAYSRLQRMNSLRCGKIHSF